MNSQLYSCDTYPADHTFTRYRT